MPFCPFVFASIADELRRESLGAKVDKINQPEKDRLVLALRGGETQRNRTLRLLICARSGAARIHYTTQSFDNPPEPPMFCMLLRKYLSGARLVAVTQPDFERVLILEFIASDELGYERTVRLIFEAAGRVPNVILTDGENHILDCMKRANLEANAVRPLLPGLFYQLPPAQEGKKNPAELDEDAAIELFARGSGPEPFDRLLNGYFGFCPLVARSVVTNAADDSPEALAASLMETVRQYTDRRFRPAIVEDPLRRSRDYVVINAKALPSVAEFTSPSEMLDSVFAGREENEKQAARTARLQKPIKTAHQRLAKKLNLQREELRRTFTRDEYRKKGDILNANLYQIPRGVASVRLPDYYDENLAEIEIALDVRLSPQQNAQKYYAEYAKLKSARNHLEGLIAEGEKELAFLENVLYDISAADKTALPRIEAELVELGYLKAANQKGRKNKPKALPALPPLEFTVDGGYTVWVGRTGKQNDELTFHTAGKSDLWFHVKGSPGSHVILFSGGEEPSALAYTQAAELAAKHSSLKGTGKVEVDYCPVRYVKKLPHAMPGMVTYDRYSTAVVDS